MHEKDERIPTGSKGSTGQVMRHRCVRGLTWGVIFSLLVSRIAGLFLYTLWLCDCFFREFKMGVQCKGFSLYPNPEIISTIWLIVISVTSLLLIFYASRLPDFPSFKSIIRHLLRKKYFYKVCVITALVIAYDVITIVGGEIQVKRTIVYCTYILEHLSSVALIFTLNFVPEFVKNTDPQSKLKYFVYKLVLLIYAVENYVIYALGTIVAAYKLVAVPTCRLKDIETKYNKSRSSTNAPGNTVCHDATSVSMLLLLLTALSLRHTIGEFFLTKIFQEKVDILDTPLQSNTLRETMDTSVRESTENTSLLAHPH